MENKGGQLFLRNLEIEREKKAHENRVKAYRNMMIETRDYDWVDTYHLVLYRN